MNSYVCTHANKLQGGCSAKNWKREGKEDNRRQTIENDNGVLVPLVFWSSDLLVLVVVVVVVAVVVVVVMVMVTVVVMVVVGAAVVLCKAMQDAAEAIPHSKKDLFFVTLF